MSPVRPFVSIVAATVLWGGAVALIPGAAQAAGTWSAPAVVSPSGSVSAPSLVAGPNGTATAIWVQTGGTDPGVITARRGADGTWGSITRLSDGGVPVGAGEDSRPQLVAEPSGPVTAIWVEGSAEYSTGRVRTARLVPSTGWGPALTIAESGSRPSLAVDSAGQVAAAWTDSYGGQVRLRNSGTTWGEPRTIDENKTEYSEYDGGNEQHWDRRSIDMTQVVACGARLMALWTVRDSHSWSAGPESEVGGSSSGPNQLYAKALPTDGTWPAFGVNAENTGLAADGLVEAACSPTFELTLTSSAEYEGYNRFGMSWSQFASATRSQGGDWAPLDVYASDSGEGSFLHIDSWHLAYGSDGALVRAVESDQQVTTLASKPRGGAWTAAKPLLPASSPTSNPFFHIGKGGQQTLLYSRDGDVPARAEARQRTGTSAAWEAPVVISKPGAVVDDIVAAGNADGTITALILERSGASAWRLTSSSYRPAGFPTPTPSPSATPRPTATPQPSTAPQPTTAPQATPTPQRAAPVAVAPAPTADPAAPVVPAPAAPAEPSPSAPAGPPSSTLSTLAPAPPKVPVTLRGKKLSFSMTLTRTGARCPSVGALKVQPKTAVKGSKVKVPVSKRRLVIQAGPGATCVVTGTVTLSRAPARSSTTVSVGARGLVTRTVVPG